MLAFTVQFSRYGRNHDLLGIPSGTPFGLAVRVRSPKRSGCFLRTQQRARQLCPRQLLVPLIPREERTNRMAVNSAAE